MKKSVITKLGAAVLAAVLLCGCQPAGGPSDEKLINATMANWKAAFMARNLRKLMATYSEDYESARGRDKKTMRALFADSFEEGDLDDIEIDLEGAEIAIEGDKAQVSPVAMIIPMWEFTLQKEYGTWRIVSSKQRGEPD